MPTSILIPGGVLGLGFDPAALSAGLEKKPHAICIDGGSTDSGPFYLGTGTSKYSAAATRSEWRDLMIARQQAGVPLVLGSCGTCGSDQAVDWMYQLTLDIASELGQSIRVARLYSSQSAEVLVTARQDDRLHPLDPVIPLDESGIKRCANIVALAGVEQISAALQTGADIVLAGRTTDTAVIAAIPIDRGEHIGASWHGAKIGECGALCSTNPTSGVILIDFDENGFSVQPMADGATCTPYSVSAHMLYENANPLRLVEPGGTLDVTNAVYEAIDERSVRVTGSEWLPSSTYTVKLEGAHLSGYQTSTMVLLRHREYVARAQEWCNKLHAFLVTKVSEQMNLDPESYDIEFRLIGVDATLGSLESVKSQPAEVGVLVLTTAETQTIATDIARLSNPFLLHFPLTESEELPTFAFPYSPAESERGALYEFSMNHVMALDKPMDAFRLMVSEVVDGQSV